MNKILGW